MQYLTSKEIKVLFDAGSLAGCCAEAVLFYQDLQYNLTFSIKSGSKCYLRTTREQNEPAEIKSLDTVAKIAREIGFKSFGVYF